MNLVSCDECGVVIDRDKIIFPEVYDHDSQELIYEDAEWNGEDYVAVVPCPVCKGNIREK